MQITAVDDNPEKKEATDDMPDDLKPESDLVELQRQDPELKVIFHYLEEGVLPENDKQARCLVLEKTNYDIVDGVLCYANPDFPDNLWIAIPQCL